MNDSVNNRPVRQSPRLFQRRDTEVAQRIAEKRRLMLLCVSLHSLCVSALNSG